MLQEVKIDTLDDIVSQEKIDKVDFIKIDVEGAELHVLQGAVECLARNTPIVFMEMISRHFRKFEYTEQDIFDFFAQRDYIPFYYSDEYDRLVPSSGFGGDALDCYFIPFAKLVTLERASCIIPSLHQDIP